MRRMVGQAVLLSHLYGRGVDVKLFEDGEGLLEELIADGNVGDVRCVVVIQPVDVLHHACAVGLDRRQNQQILEVSGHGRQMKRMNDLACFKSLPPRVLHQLVITEPSLPP